MQIQECNPYVRIVQIQPAILEGSGLRAAYDHRIFYVLSGDGLLELEDKEIPIAEDSLILIAPGIGYNFNGKMRVIVINYDLTRNVKADRKATCPPPISEFSKEGIFDPEMLEGLPETVILRSGAYFRDSLMEIVHNFKEDDIISDAITSAQLKKLLSELLRADRKKNNPEKELVDEVRRYIMLHATEHIDNEHVGKHFGYHPVYIANLFKKHTGQTMHNVIISERVKFGAHMILMTDRSIEEVALESGFCSRSHFCNTFKKIMGVSPFAYRGK